MIEFSAVSNRVSEQLCRTSDAARFQSVARSFKTLLLGAIQPEFSMHRGRLDGLSGAQSSFTKFVGATAFFSAVGSSLESQTKALSLVFPSFSGPPNGPS
jgi:hypothetical protein